MTETTTPENAHDINELNEAVALAQASVGVASAEAILAAPDASTTATDDTVAAPMTAQDRAKRTRERAQRQRKLGSEEMQREYAGVMVVKQSLEINDQNVASSALRFLALTDKTIYLLKRMGGRIMTPAQSEELMGRLQEKFNEYCLEAQQAAAASSELLQKCKAEDMTFMWIQPVYVASTLSHEFQIKNRPVLPLFEAIKHWDSAIGHLSELEFNGQATADQIDQIRVRERRLFSGINYLCYQIVMGLSRKTPPVVQPN